MAGKEEGTRTSLALHKWPVAVQHLRMMGPSARRVTCVLPTGWKAACPLANDGTRTETHRGGGLAKKMTGQTGRRRALAETGGMQT